MIWSSVDSEVRDLSSFSRSFSVMDAGEVTSRFSAVFSSFSATTSLHRMRKNAARKDIIAAKDLEIERHRKVEINPPA